jgi:hypothetical protein
VRPSVPVLLVSLAVCAGLTALAARILDWSFQRAATLSPVIVLVFGAAAFLVVLWTRIAWESIRRRDRHGGRGKPGTP